MSVNEVLSGVHRAEDLAMALSDYERRVLREIEAELALPGPGRLARCRAAAIRLRFRLLLTVALLFTAVLLGLLAPPEVALGLDAVAGFALGWLWAPPPAVRSRSR